MVLNRGWDCGSPDATAILGAIAVPKDSES